MKFKSVYLLITLIFVTGLFDILTTIGLGSHESNPISLFIGGLKIALLFKVFGMFYICFWLIKINNLKGDFAKFILVGVSVLLVAGQIIAGINNVQVKKVIPSDSPGHVTVSERIDASITYLRVMFSIYAYPLMILSLTYLFWYFITKKGDDKR